MKRVMLTVLAFLLLLSATGCRRRITADSETVVQETVYQPNPVPMDGQGQQVPDASMGADPDNSKTEIDPDGDRVEGTVPAQGGETVDNADDPQTGEEITVTLDAMGGQCSVHSVTVRFGGVYGDLPTPTLIGHNFQGWFLKPEGGEPVTMVTAVLEENDHTLYAHWTTKTEFLLTFDPNGGRISPYSATKTVYSGDVYGRLPEPMRSGYAFLGWFTEPEGGTILHPTDMVTVIDDTTVYAHWEYNPLSYWTFVLENATQKVFTCQEVSIYLELEANGTTMLYSPLISDIGGNNIAQDSIVVSDDWVKEQKPNVIVKLTDHMATAEATLNAMKQRFPDARIVLLPVEAVEGTQAEQLFCKLQLAALCYPQYYYEIDMSAVAKELGVSITMRQ